MVPMTQSEKVRFSREHLKHEVFMFLSLALELRPVWESPGSPGPGQVTENAHLDSFVIHTRALMDFFFPRGRAEHEDVIAAHYVDDPSVFHKSLTPALDLGRTKADKYLAHLSPSRPYAGEPEKPWDIDGIRNEMVELLDLLVANANDGLHTEIESLIREHKKRWKP